MYQQYFAIADLLFSFSQIYGMCNFIPSVKLHSVCVPAGVTKITMTVYTIGNQEAEISRGSSSIEKAILLMGVRCTLK